MFDVPSCQPLADAFFDSDFSRVQISLVEYVGISSIDDGHRRAAVILSACSSQRNVVSGVEDHFGLREDRVVLDLRLSDGGAVVGEDDQLGLTAAQTAQSGPVAQHVLAALDDEAQLVVDVLRTHLFHHKKLLFNQIIFQDLIQQLYAQRKREK